MKKKFLFLALAVMVGVMIFGQADYTQEDLVDGNWVISGNVTMYVAQWLDITKRDIKQRNDTGDIKPLNVYDYGEIETWNPEESNPTDQNKYGAIELTIGTNALIKMAITGINSVINNYIKKVEWRIYRQTPDGSWRPASGWEGMNTFITINDINDTFISFAWTYIQLKFELDKDTPPNATTGYETGYDITIDIAFQPTVTL